MQESDVKCGVGIGWRSWSCVRAGARANEPFRKVGEEEEEEKEKEKEEEDDEPSPLPVLLLLLLSPN